MNTKDKIHEFYSHLLDMMQTTEGAEHKSYTEIIWIFRFVFKDELKDYKPIDDYGI